MRIHANLEIRIDALRIFNALEADRRWHDAATLDQSGKAIELLAKLRLIWVQQQNGVVDIRFPTATTVGELIR